MNVDIVIKDVIPQIFVLRSKITNLTVVGSLRLLKLWLG